MRRVERILPVGTVVTAVGELSTGSPRPGSGLDGERCYILQKPRDFSIPFYITDRSLPEIIHGLSTISRFCKVILSIPEQKLALTQDTYVCMNTDAAVCKSC